MNIVLHYSLLLTIPTVILVHLVASPYTKVEESFNIQAVNDILEHGIPLSDHADYLARHYDHFSFPGAVPRSFVGALALAAAAWPFKLLHLKGEHMQMLVRAILGLANAGALLAFSQAVNHAFGTVACYWYILLQATQFHVIYYASRTLPNSFAFALTTLALRFFVMSSFGPRPKRQRRARTALVLTTFAGVVLRSELALLVAAESALLLLLDPRSLRSVVLPAGILAGTAGLAVTVPVDSFFWQRFPLWPEWTAFRFNTLDGHSAAWGTSPWHFYLTAALPKLMLNPLALALCIPAALLARPTRAFSVRLLGPLLAFVAAYSALPHKEWRFVVYAVPGLTGVAAAGAGAIWVRRRRGLAFRLLAAALVASVALSAVASAALLFVSSLNYPGGAALARLHGIADRAGAGSATVFLDNLSCQTGVTRFLQNDAAGWVYDKTEDPAALADPAFWSRFDYILAEAPEKYPGEWDVVGYVRAYAGVSLTGGESVWRVLAPQQSGPDSALVGALALLDQAEAWIKARVTGGRWPGIRMEPRISILKRRA